MALEKGHSVGVGWIQSFGSIKGDEVDAGVLFSADDLRSKILAGGQAKDDQTPEPPHQNSSASTRTRPPGSAHLGHHHIPATRTHGTHYRESKGDKQLFKQVA
jgi:hypothetical protein